MTERRHHYRMPWLALPEIRRWEDMLPDLTRTPMINPVISVPRSELLDISTALQNIYVKERKAYSESHELHQYDRTEKQG